MESTIILQVCHYGFTQWTPVFMGAQGRKARNCSTVVQILKTQKDSGIFGFEHERRHLVVFLIAVSKFLFFLFLFFCHEASEQLNAKNITSWANVGKNKNILGTMLRMTSMFVFLGNLPWPEFIWTEGSKKLLDFMECK